MNDYWIKMVNDVQKLYTWRQTILWGRHKHELALFRRWWITSIDDEKLTHLIENAFASISIDGGNNRNSDHRKACNKENSRSHNPTNKKLVICLPCRVTLWGTHRVKYVIKELFKLQRYSKTNTNSCGQKHTNYLQFHAKLLSISTSTYTCDNFN